MTLSHSLHLRPITMLLNLVLVVVAMVPAAVYYLQGSPFERGFFCDDKELSLPYKESTVPFSSLVVVGVLANVLAVLVVEKFFVRPSESDKSESRKPLLEALRILTGFGFGTAITTSLTVIVKFNMGSLRPNFFDVCRPDLSTVDCSHFVSNYTCLGNPDLFPDVDQMNSEIMETRLSFFSGHTSFAVQAAFFFALYLQARMCGGFRRSLLLLPLLQSAALAMAALTSLSRIIDHKHHVVDVVGGAFVGSLVQYFIIIHVLGLFDKTTKKNEVTNTLY